MRRSTGGSSKNNMLIGAACVYVLFLSGGLSVGLARVLGLPRRGLGAAVRLSAVRVHRKWSHAPTRILTKCCFSLVGDLRLSALMCVFLLVCVCVCVDESFCLFRFSSPFCKYAQPSTNPRNLINKLSFRISSGL